MKTHLKIFINQVAADQAFYDKADHSPPGAIVDRAQKIIIWGEDKLVFISAKALRADKLRGHEFVTVCGMANVDNEILAEEIKQRMEHSNNKNKGEKNEKY